MKEYTLSELLLFEPKRIGVLRNKNLLVQRFHNALISCWENNNNEHWAEMIINEAYLLCAMFKNDDEPTDDVYYRYIETCRKDLGKEGLLYQPALLLFGIIIEEYGNQLKSKNILKDIDFEFFVNEIRSQIDFFEQQEYWERVTPSIIEAARKMDMIAFMDIHPISPENVISLCNYSVIDTETHGFDQNTIRRIISRYPDKEQQLFLLQIIHNLWKGLDAYGNDDYPF